MAMKNNLFLILLVCSISIFANNLKQHESLDCQTVPVYVDEEDCEESGNPFLLQNPAMGDKAIFVSPTFFNEEIAPMMDCAYEAPVNEIEAEIEQEEFERELSKFEEDRLELADGDIVGGPGAAAYDSFNQINVAEFTINGDMDSITGLDEDRSVDEIFEEGNLVLDGRTRIESFDHHHVDKDEVSVWEPEERLDNVPDDDFHSAGQEVPVNADGSIDYDALLTRDPEAYEPYDLSSFGDE
jgi:hypothetical protein